MLKNIKIIFLVLVIIIITIPVLTFNFTPNSVSEIDNRYLTEIPVGQVDDFSENWSNYINDRIGYRDKSIATNTKLNDALFKNMIHPSYEYGEDGYIFFKLGVPKHDYGFLDIYVNHVKNIQNYCKQRNVPFIYVINPAKITVYKEYLPKGYNYENERLNYLIKKLDENKINYVNNTDLLIKRSKKEQVFNKKYDAGHWNDLGAFYGINNIIKKVQNYFPEIKQNNLDDFDISTVTQTSLPVSQFDINEEVPKFKIKKDILDDMQSLSSANEEIRIDETQPAFQWNKNEKTNNDVKALYFQGSYMNSRYQMAQLPFSECINIHGYQNVINFDYYFNIFKPDVVIFESAEYATTDYYYNPEKMNNKILNPLINQLNVRKVKTKIEVEKKEYVVSINVDIPKSQHAYITMGNQVFDLLWDEENKNYYCDIDKNNYSNDYSVFVYDKK